MDALNDIDFNSVGRDMETCPGLNDIRTQFCLQRHGNMAGVDFLNDSNWLALS